MKPGHSLNPYDIGSCTLYIRSHAVEKIGYIHHMWFLRCILNNRVPLSERCGKHDIDGSSNRFHIKIDMSAYKPVCLSSNHSIGCINLCSHSLKSIYMLVNRSCTYVTATRKCHMGFPVFSKQCTQKIVGAPYLLRLLIINNRGIYKSTINLVCVSVNLLNHCPNTRNSS